MRRAEILPMVEDAIYNRIYPGPHKYYIFWKDGKIQCAPAYCTSPPEILFAVFNNDTLKKGLSTHQWTMLEDVIVRVLTQKGVIDAVPLRQEGES